MQPDVVLHSRRSDGLGLLLGSLWWPRPYYPTRDERASLVASALPMWAIATGSTAAWVWSGFGEAQPWSVLRQRHPAISPIERTHWGAHAVNPDHHRVVTLAGLALLNRADTAREVLLGTGPIDSSAAQVFALSGETRAELQQQCGQRRTTATQREHAVRVLDRVDHLRRSYPDITR